MSAQSPPLTPAGRRRRRHSEEVCGYEARENGSTGDGNGNGKPPMDGGGNGGNGGRRGGGAGEGGQAQLHSRRGGSGGSGGGGEHHSQQNHHHHQEREGGRERDRSGSKGRLRSFWTRAWSSVWMILGFAAIIYLGHVYIWGLIIVCMVRELYSLADHAQRHKVRPLKFLNWHFFVTAAVYVYGRFMDHQLMTSFAISPPDEPAASPSRRLLALFAQYHPIICYTLYITGFVWFILSLETGKYKAQFGQFAWTHMILLIVFFQSSFFLPNIFQGMIWFLLPASLIIVNDCAAYVFGVLFGRTPLIKLSPKKTWEGFIGASVTTVIAAFLLAGFMGRFLWLTCPRKDLSTGPLACNPGPMFESHEYDTPAFLASWGWESLSVTPVQLHALAFGLFASSIAPFGGFFASGFKRAFKIKDFGDSIPGHGGITDRMDCQMVMAVFAYIYYSTFIAPRSSCSDSLLSTVMDLDKEQQMELYVRLSHLLLSQGLGLQDLARLAART
eukprot:jgi/Mesen1/5427/ME000027S04802